MLPRTEEALTKFRKLNQDMFYGWAQEVKPPKSYEAKNSAPFGHFSEITTIYQSMYSLALALEEQMFYGNFANAYSNPMEVIISLKRFSKSIKSEIKELIFLNEKYSNHNIPIYYTLENYQKTDNLIDYILNLNEIKEEIVDVKQNSIKDELIFLKTSKQFREKQIKIILLALFYILFLLIPALLITLNWDTEKNNSYFQLFVFLFPLGSFIYDRSSFFEIFKFLFSKKYRITTKNFFRNELEKNYLVQET